MIRTNFIHDYVVDPTEVGSIIGCSIERGPQPGSWVVTTLQDLEILRSMTSFQGRMAGSFMLDDEQVRKLPHTVICNYLFGFENGTPIRIFYPETGEEGKGTPDYVDRAQDIVAELKTTRGGSEKAFQDAMSAYNAWYTDSVINYYGIAVSPDSVISSLGIKEVLERGIVKFSKCPVLLRMAHALQASAQEKGLQIQVRENPELSFPGSLEEISSDPLLITNSMIRRWEETPEESLPTYCARHLMYSDSVVEVEFGKDKPHEQEWTNMPMLLVEQGSDFSDLQGVLPGVFGPYISCEDIKSVVNQKFSIGSLPQLTPEVVHNITRGLWASKVDPKQQETSAYRSSEGSRKKSPFSPEDSSRLLELINEKRSIKQRLNIKPADYGYMEWASCMYEAVEEKYKFKFETLKDVRGLEINSDYESETWYQASRFLSFLYGELNMGSIKARGNWSDFYFHRVPGYKCVVIQHSTGKENHQFYWLLFKGRVLVENQSYYKLNNGWIGTEICNSVNTSKISQYLLSHERLVCLRKYFDDRYGSRGLTFHKISLGAYLDGKQATIDLLSLWRYFYMDTTSMMGGTMKIFTKVPQPLRTKFQAEMLHRMIIFSKDKSSLHTNQEGELDLKKCLNWITMKPMESSWEFMDLSYMHYSLPHPASIGMHGQVQILQKLIEQEKLLPEDCSFIGWNNSPQNRRLGPHEFSLGVVKMLGRLTAEKLVQRYPNYDSFEDRLSSECSMHSWSFFMSMSKTTVFDPSGSKRGKRDYCILEIKKLSDLGLLDLKTPPLSQVPSYLSTIEEDPRHNYVSIFIKDQQVGVREIFVLPMLMRLSMKLVELTSRCINSVQLNECLYDPSRDKSIIRNHRIQVHRAKESLRKEYKVVKSFTLTSSCDAATWCQQFCMPNFGLFLWSILHHAYGEKSKPLATTLLRALNCITRKKIIIPERLEKWLKITEMRPEDFDSETLSFLVSLGDTISEGVTNRSNMMQGVPHETSSALHAAYMDLAVSMARFICVEKMKSIELMKDEMCIATSQVSSDDNGFHVTCVWGELEGQEVEENDLSELKATVCMSCMLVERGKETIEAKGSVKSSIAQVAAYEFKSEFHLGSSDLPASVKFVTSVFSGGYHIRLEDRVSEGLSSLAQALENGVPQTTLNVMQCCLNRSIRRLIHTPTGDDISKEVVDLQLNNMLPSMGWLPLLPIGLIGFFSLKDVALIIISRRLPLCKKWGAWFDKFCDVDELSIEDRLRFYLDRAKRHRKLLEDLNIKKEGLMEKYGMSPESLYTNSVPVLMQWELKLLNEGVKRSMSHVTPSRIHAVSCYSAYRKVFSLPKEISKEKLTLLEALRLISSSEISEFELENLTKNYDVSRLLPIWDLCQDLRIIDMRPQFRGMKKTSLFLRSLDFTCPAHATRLMGELWFQGSSGRNHLRALRIASWRNSKISRSYDDTLQRYGGDHLAIWMYINSMDSEDRTVRLLCRPPDNKASTLDIVLSYWETCFGSFRTGRLPATTIVKTFIPPVEDKEIQLSKSDMIVINKVYDLYSIMLNGWRCLYRRIREMIVSELTSLKRTNPSIVFKMKIFCERCRYEDTRNRVLLSLFSMPGISGDDLNIFSCLRYTNWAHSNSDSTWEILDGSWRHRQSLKEQRHVGFKARNSLPNATIRNDLHPLEFTSSCSSFRVWAEPKDNSISLFCRMTTEPKELGSSCLVVKLKGIFLTSDQLKLMMKFDNSRMYKMLTNSVYGGLFTFEDCINISDILESVKDYKGERDITLIRSCLSELYGELTNTRLEDQIDLGSTDDVIQDKQEMRFDDSIVARLMSFLGDFMKKETPSATVGGPESSAKTVSPSLGVEIPLEDANPEAEVDWQDEYDYWDEIWQEDQKKKEEERELESKDKGHMSMKKFIDALKEREPELSQTVPSAKYVMFHRRSKFSRIRTILRYRLEQKQQNKELLEDAPDEGEVSNASDLRDREDSSLLSSAFEGLVPPTPYPETGFGRWVDEPEYKEEVEEYFFGSGRVTGDPSKSERSE